MFNRFSFRIVATMDGQQVAYEAETIQGVIDLERAAIAAPHNQGIMIGNAVHLSGRQPFTAVCGANTPNQKTTADPKTVTCGYCAQIFLERTRV